MIRWVPMLFCSFMIVCHAWGSMRPYDPFQHMNSTTIEITIGNQINANGESSDRLFYNDHARQHRFEEDLRKTISSRLEKSGIHTDPDSTGAVLIGIWGHSIPARECGLDFVFTIEFSAFAEENGNRGPCEEDNADVSQGVIGTASNQELEKVLMDSVMNLLDDHLRGVDYAATREPEPIAAYPQLGGVSIEFDHFGGRVDPLDLHMGETGEPTVSDISGDDYWLRLRNNSSYTISFRTYSMYVREPAAQLFTLKSGKKVLALEDGMEVSIEYILLDENAKRIPYTAIDNYWVSFLPPGRSVIFGVPQDQLSTAASLFVQFTAVDQPEASIYRSHYSVSADRAD